MNNAELSRRVAQIMNVKPICTLSRSRRLKFANTVADVKDFNALPVTYQKWIRQGEVELKKIRAAENKT